MERLELDTIIYEGETIEEGAVAIITLNRTERLNASCRAMAKQHCGKGKFGWLNRIK